LGFKDWLGRVAPATPQTGPADAPARTSGEPIRLKGRRFSLDRDRMFDIEMTGKLEALFRVPRDARDDLWKSRFFDAAWTASIELPDQPAFVGPDGFPYLRINVPSPGPFDSQCLGNLAPACLENLTGAALFTSPDEPPENAEYVLSLGHIDSLLTFDSPDGDPVDVAEAIGEQDPSYFSVEKAPNGERLRVEKEHVVFTGLPSREFLPSAQARALHRHLAEGWGLADPRVSLIADPHLKPTRSLVIGRNGRSSSQKRSSGP